MWTGLSGPEVGGREEEQSWNQVLYLEGTGMLRLNLNKAQGKPGSWLVRLQKSFTEHVHVAGVPAGARFGDYCFGDKQKQVKSIWFLSRGSLLDR